MPLQHHLANGATMYSAIDPSLAGAARSRRAKPFYSSGYWVVVTDDDQRGYRQSPDARIGANKRDYLRQLEEGMCTHEEVRQVLDRATPLRSALRPSSDSGVSDGGGGWRTARG